MSVSGLSFWCEKLSVSRSLKYLQKNIKFKGGHDGRWKNTILEYDISGDFFTEIGTMLEARSIFAVSVVKYVDFSDLCK